MKHAKVKTVQANEDGSITITNESYYEELSNYVKEIQKQQMTTTQTFEADIARVLEKITREGTPQLQLTIKATKGEPKKIIYRWIEKQEKLGR